jgi:uncharacterized protein (TIGR04255 family)
MASSEHRKRRVPKAAAGFPTPDKRVLRHPPLEVAIFEVRTLGGALGNDPRDGLALLQAVQKAGWGAERVEPAMQQTMQLQLAPQQPPASLLSVQNQGWQLVETSSGTTATLFPQVVAVQTGTYVTWGSTFRPVVEAVLTATARHVKPAMRQRVALRYVDRLVDPTADTPASWQGRVADALLGAIADPLPGVRVRTAQQQMELTLDGGHQAILRHGPFVDGAEHNAISYLIDIDVFDAATGGFLVEEVLSVADDIAVEALALFQVALDNAYLSQLRGEQ